MHRRAGTHMHPGRWTPDRQRTTPQVHSASKTRVNALMALRSIRGTQTHISKKRVRALPPGPGSLSGRPALLAAGNLVVDALDVEVHAKHLAVVETVAALALDGLAFLVNDRTFEREQLALGDGGFGVHRQFLHVVGHVC